MVNTKNYLSFPLLVPRIIRILQNWPLYFVNYICRRKQPAEYRFRNGFRIIDSTGSLAGTIAVVFVREEYGRFRNLETIVDIGANMGAFAIYAAWHCPNATIYCYEPETKNYSYLENNITINKLKSRVLLFREAVARESGMRKIFTNESPLHSLIPDSRNECCEEVNCITLGDIFKNQRLEKIDLLKINCEGAEYEIIENCSAIDLKRIYDLRLEYHNFYGSIKNGNHLLKVLKSKGFIIQKYSKYGNVSGFIWARQS